MRCAILVLAVSLSLTSAHASPLDDDGTCDKDNFVNVIWAEGNVIHWPEQCDTAFSRLLEAAKTLATRDLACAEPINAYKSRVDDNVIVADGCGHRATYLTYGAARGDSKLIPGYEGHRLYVQVYLLTRSTPDRLNVALVGLNAYLDKTKVPGHFMTASFFLDPYLLLVEAAVHDLHCPATDIYPMLVRSSSAARIPVAEGCGTRATYLPFGYAMGARAIIILSALLKLTP